MESLANNKQASNHDAALVSGASELSVVYRVYDDEATAAHAAQLLVESGFSPQDVFVGVMREGRPQRAYTGRAVRRGIAVSFGAAVSCILGMLLVTSATLGLVPLSLEPLTGLSAISATTLSLFLSAVPGALVGWLVAALLWRRGAPSFPAAQASKPAFVGVEVGPGNMFTAHHSLLHARDTVIARKDGWSKLASNALAA